MAKKIKSKKVTQEEVSSKFDISAMYSSTVDEVAKKQDFDSDLLEDMPPMSTGILMLDLIMGGGIRPSWITSFGPEQSCKTTGALTIMAAAIKSKVPIISLADFEGSTRNSKPYVANILRTAGLKVSIKEVFGKKDSNTGKWIIPPVVRYRSETIGEKFFDYLADLLRKLPDKKFIAGKWWLVFDDTKENKAKLADNANSAMAKKYGKGLWIEAPDGNLQALLIVDSYPAMNPIANDDEDTNNSLALQARMFSKQLPRVKGRLASKMVAVIGINQLRAVPMAMYGPKETEPGGVALKFNCFSGDTLLQTDVGLLTALEASQLNIQSLNGIAGKEELGGWKSTGIARIFGVSTALGYQVRGKKGHKVLSLSLGEKDLPNICWERLDKLDIGKISGRGNYLAISKPILDVENFPKDYRKITYRAIARAKNQFGKDIISCILDEKFGELLGWIVSEGFVGPYVTIVSNHNDKHKRRIARILQEFNLGKVTITDKAVSINSVVFAEWLVSIKAGGILSRYKEVPRIIRQSPLSVQIAFLKGLFGGDGSASPSSTSYSSLSNTLLEQVQIMLLNLGIISHRKLYKMKNTEHRLELALQETSLTNLMDMNNAIMFQGKFRVGSINLYGKAHTNLRQLLGWKTRNLQSNRIINEMRIILPPIFGASHYASIPKIVNWFDTNIKRGAKHFRLSSFYNDWFDDYLIWIETLRTSHEREKALHIGKCIKSFIDYTEEHDLIWSRIDSIDMLSEQPTFDCNMPQTNTVITNGIVSHNSDVRIQWTPMKSGVPMNPKFDSDDGLEHERSVLGAGKDRYRYIRMKAIKNKLWTPGRKSFVRLWVEDAKGEARGFDPVFDTIVFLKETGQLSGNKRSSMSLNLYELGQAKKSVDWMMLKTWISGTKEEKIKICTLLGYKPLDLRILCFKQLVSGKAEALYIATKAESKKDEVDEE